MATISVCGFGFGADPGNMASNGTRAYQTTIKRSPGYAGRLNQSGVESGYFGICGVGSSGIFSSDPGINAASLWINFAFYVATLPASGSDEMFSTFTTTGAGVGLSVRITSLGKLAAYNDADSLVATGTTSLSTGQWYAISMKLVCGAGAAYEIRINGTVELSGTANQGTGVYRMMLLGRAINRSSQAIDFYYDDFIADDAAYPTDGYVVTLVPIANGSTMQWTGGTGSSDYTQVNEIPADGATYIQCGTGGNQVALFRVTTTATAGISGTINGLSVATLIREVTSTTSSNKMRVKSGGTTLDTSAARDYGLAFAVNWRLFATDPNTSAAWTTAAVDAVEVGCIEVNAVAMRMDRIGVEVHYTPRPASGFFQLLGSPG